MCIRDRLYANAHNRHYPTPHVFYSKEFEKYMEMALGKKEKSYDSYYKDSPYGTLGYVQTKKYDGYKLWAPRVHMYGLKEMYFSPKTGLVIVPKK